MGCQQGKADSMVLGLGIKASKYKGTLETATQVGSKAVHHPKESSNLRWLHPFPCPIYS
jgi:hypothetical protein